MARLGGFGEVRGAVMLELNNKPENRIKDEQALSFRPCFTRRVKFPLEA